MPKKPQPRADNLRRAVAQEAARIMYEHGVQDFRFAKRKAAERFGATDEAVMPRNAEVEAALEEYQRLFGGEEHVESLLAQRLVAVDVMQVLREAYAGERFVRIVDHLPGTKDTVNTNFCDITARVVRGRVLLISCLDNLVKGAAGAAVQNFNCLFGLPEALSLR